MNWKQFDERMLSEREEDLNRLNWYDPSEEPFHVEGLYWFEETKQYTRFREKDIVELQSCAPGAAALSRHSSGGKIKFTTDSEDIYVAVRLRSPSGMDHFAATGESGIDCYFSYPQEERYHFAGVSRFDRQKDSYICSVTKEHNAERKKVLLHLPLYAEVLDLKIGLNKGAHLFKENDEDPCPIVFYGTSITQGGCASRPGMMYTNILSRKMNIPFLNYGFSGSGLGEHQVAQILAQIQNPRMYVLCYEANAGNKLKDTLDSFVRIIRSSHPNVPVLIVSRIQAYYELSSEQAVKNREELRIFQETYVKEQSQAGDRHIFYLDGRTLLPDAMDECFVDGDHPTDLGFWQIALHLEPTIKKILQLNE